LLFEGGPRGQVIRRPGLNTPGGQIKYFAGGATPGRVCRSGPDFKFCALGRDSERDFFGS